MFNAHDLSLSFGGTPLFEGFTFRLQGGDRVGLIGKNGAGKSTLLKLLHGDHEPDAGIIAKDREISIGFLRQDIDFVVGRTVLEEAYTAFDEILELEKRLEEINEQLAARTDYESDSYTELITELSDVTILYEMKGGYTYPADTERILKGLGFSSADFQKQTDTFSGGWRMRIELAKLLLQRHDILLLDEPTNHLDIDSILWLEQWLVNYSGAVMIVSHDKQFLDNVTNRTMQISLGQLYDYPKAYSDFLVLRAELRDQQMAAQKNQQAEIARAERLIDKFKAKATKASMAQSLMKKLDRMDRIEVEQEDTAVMNIRFPKSITPGKVVLELESVGKSYGEKEVFKDIDLMLPRGTRTAFVGQNGQGKSTLAKVIVGELDHTGVVKHGHNVSIGYFAQNQSETLDGEKTILDTMIDEATDSNRIRVREMLGAFLFGGDEVEKKVKVLSGGERNRLALCKMLLHPFNLLIMDEPTNHLDIRSKNVLKDALKNYDGTLIVVSHDRDFLAGLTDTVHEFRDGAMREYLGDINYYLDERKALDMREIEKVKKVKTVQSESPKAAQLSYEDRKRQKSLKNRLSKAESTMADLERQVKAMDVQLETDYDATVADPKFFDKYNRIKQDLSATEDKWTEISMELEELDQ